MWSAGQSKRGVANPSRTPPHRGEVVASNLPAAEPRRQLFILGHQIGFPKAFLRDLHGHLRDFLLVGGGSGSRKEPPAVRCAVSAKFVGGYHTFRRIRPPGLGTARTGEIRITLAVAKEIFAAGPQDLMGRYVDEFEAMFRPNASPGESSPPRGSRRIADC